MKQCDFCLFNELTYPQIKIDENGKCDVCYVNEQRISAVKLQRSDFFLEQMIQKIKVSRTGDYDCLIGVSGGADSTYLVHLALEWGLNPLLLHVDGGWNSKIAVENIRNLVETTGFDYVCEVLDWNEMRELQLSFIKSDVLDIDLPFDNAMLAYNYSIANKFGIKYILNGYTTETEGILPEGFTHYKLDKRNLKGIYKKFTGKSIQKIKLVGTFDHIYYDKIKKIRFVYPLDWINYSKEESTALIQERYAWQSYGAKHYDNVFTRFYQGYILPNKFSIDKRISHISMLICSKQITLEEAKKMYLSNPYYPNKEMEMDDLNFFIKKLGLSHQEFEEYMGRPAISHRNFKSDLDYYDFFRPFYSWIKKVFKFRIFNN